MTAPSDAAAFDAYVSRRSERFVPLGLFLREREALAAVFNLSEIVRGAFCSAYLGYYVFDPFAQQGHMRAGLGLLLELGFEHLGLHRVEANIQPKNTRSIALVRGCGFVREGYSPGYLFIAGAWRDHERWAIRREIWPEASDIAAVSQE